MFYNKILINKMNQCNKISNRYYTIHTMYLMYVSLTYSMVYCYQGLVKFRVVQYGVIYVISCRIFIDKYFLCVFLKSHYYGRRSFVRTLCSVPICNQANQSPFHISCTFFGIFLATIPHNLLAKMYLKSVFSMFKTYVFSGSC